MTMLARWLLGTGLVSWRYLWMTTPLHRALEVGDHDGDLPPRLPAELFDEEIQLAGQGVGPLFHRTFSIRVCDPTLSAERVMSDVTRDFGRFVPREVVAVTGDGRPGLRPGQEMTVRMPGPWDGPVRVVEVGPGVLHLATLRGHLEAGQVRFTAEHDGSDLIFAVEAWARCATPLVRLLYGHLRLAKEVQLNMWVRFCLSVARASGGRVLDGVHVRTREVPEARLPAEPAADGRARLGETLRPDARGAPRGDRSSGTGRRRAHAPGRRRPRGSAGAADRPRSR